METLLRNLRFSLRSLRRKPMLTGAALICLALGIGANTAVFSVVNNLLLRALPFEEGDSLVRIRDAYRAPGEEEQRYSVAPRNFVAWEEQGDVFDGMLAQQAVEINITGDGEPLRVRGAAVTADWADVLGIEPIRGRTFRPGEDGPDGADVALLGHGLWQRRFGGQEDLVGDTVTLNGEVYTVVGILPPGLEFPYGAEVWIPIELEPDAVPQRHNLNVVARLAEGVTPEKAQVALNTIARRLEQEYPDTNQHWRVYVESLRQDFVGDYRSGVLILMGAAGFVLLIACASVANLLLARSLEQAGEMAIRTAVGADRRQIIGQLLTQSIVLALVGGALGLLLAYLSTEPLMALSPVEDLGSYFQTIHMDPRVLVFTFGISLLVGVVFGLIPAAVVSRTNLQQLFKEGRASTGSSKGRRVLGFLVGAEIAVAVILLAGAGLMLGGLQEVLSVDYGFDEEDVLALQMALPEESYPEDPQWTAFFDAAKARIESLPGIESAAFVSTIPVADSVVGAPFSIREHPLEPGEYLICNHRVVTPDYFSTMRIPIVDGRPIEAQDQREGLWVAVVSESLARRYWPGESAVGKQIKYGPIDGDAPWRTIVGVAGDVEENGDIEETWYLPHTQRRWGEMSLVARTSVEPQGVVASVRQQIWEVDPNQPVYGVTTLEEMVADLSAPERFHTVLFVLFAGLGLVLAAAGIYGLMSYSVRQSFHEIGVRVAIGASPGQVRRMVLRRGMILTGIGLLVGIVGSLALSRFLTGIVAEVDPYDPLVLALVCLGLAAVAFLATFLPARRATRVDPVLALRNEA